MAPQRKPAGRRVLLLAAALAAAALALTMPAATAAGARLPVTVTGTDTASAAWSRVQGLMRGEGLPRTEGGDDDSDAGKGKSHKHRAIMSIKYEVPPSLQQEFVDEWRKLDDATSQEKGNLVYDLKKTWDDNLYFWAYGEWKSYEDYIDHFRSDSAESFLSWVDDHDVMWTLYPLKNITDESAAKSAKADPASLSKKGKDDKGGDSDDPRDHMAHVVIQYHVQPSHVDEFLDAWQDAAESTWDEEDNKIYALRKVANMNHHFLAYGTWKDYDAYMDHFTSKHVRKLREFLAERDIQWFAEPLMKKGKQPEDA